MLHPLIRHWRAIGLSAVCVAVAGFVIVGLAIGRQVKDVITTAQSRHPGEPCAALIALAGSADAPPSERNRAIWALGQLGSSEALPLLKSMVANGECEHGAAVCQREVKKAIDLCSGSFNAGAVIWRH